MVRQVFLALASLLASASPVSASAQENQGQVGRAVEPGLQEWQAQHGEEWRARIHPQTGMVRMLSGGKKAAESFPVTEADWSRVAGVNENGGSTMMIAAGVKKDFIACYGQVKQTDNGEMLIDPKAMEMLNIGPGDRVLAVGR